MKDNNPPNLPAMSTHERRIWAASHQLPEDMLLVSVGEMMAMREAFDACLREVNQWRQLGKIYMGADLPESFEPALRTYMAEKERLEREAKAHQPEKPLFKVDLNGATVVPFPAQSPAGAVKIPATVRPEEV